MKCELCGKRKTKTYLDPETGDISYYCEDCAVDMGYPHTLKELKEEE